MLKIFMLNFLVVIVVAVCCAGILYPVRQSLKQVQMEKYASQSVQKGGEFF